MFTIAAYQELLELEPGRSDIGVINLSTVQPLEIRELCLLASHVPELYKDSVPKFLQQVKKVPLAALKKEITEILEKKVEVLLETIKASPDLKQEDLEVGIGVMLNGGHFSLPVTLQNGKVVTLLPRTEMTLKDDMIKTRYNLVKAHLASLDDQMLTEAGKDDLLGSLPYMELEKLYFFIGQLDDKISNIDWKDLLKN